MESDDEVVFFLREITSLHVRAQIIHPPQPAALATSFQAYTKTKTKTLKGTDTNTCFSEFFNQIHKTHDDLTKKEEEMIK